MKKTIVLMLIGIFYFSNSLMAQEEIMETESSLAEIKEKEAVEMVKRYKKKRWNRIRKVPMVGSRYDSRTFWYDIQTLEDIIKKAKKAGGTGIRIYYGVYGNDYQYNGIDYSTRHTLIFVPTKDTLVKNSVAHWDRTKNEKIIIINSVYKKDNGEVIADNHGEICPPPQGCTGALLLKKAEEKKKPK